MATFTYDDILKRVESNGALNPINSAGGDNITVEYTVQQLQPIDFPMKDLDYESSFTAKQQDIAKVLSITADSIGFTNTYVNSPQILINSDRVTINTKRDYLMLFGGAGVAISSKNPVNLDSDSSITMAATDGLYLGVPNKGTTPWPKISQPKTKGDPTQDQAYEPVTLGIKLANLLEDLLVTLKNARIATPVGLAYFREDVQYDLANLQARLPEILSTAVFVDGVSHESTDPAPNPPQTITNPTGTITGTQTGAQTGGGGTPIVGSGSGQNANKLRETLRQLGYSEKGSEIDNGGVDISANIERAASSLLRTIKQQLPKLNIIVTGGNDKYHQSLSYNSRHKLGNAIDFVVYPNDTQTLDKVVKILRQYAAGNNPNFRFIDEYRNLTAAGTGNHFHVSWGQGTESQNELNTSLALVRSGQITPIQIT